MKYKELVEQKRNRIKRLQEDLEEILDNCPHEEDGKSFIVQKSKYYGGSYYDTSYTNYWNECEVCGQRSEVTTKSHGSYG